MRLCCEALPYPEADRIVSIKDIRRQGLSTGGLVGVRRYFDLLARNRSFENLGFFYFHHLAMAAGANEPVALRAAATNHQFWTVFGVKPFLGRTFDEEGRRTSCA